MGFRLYRGTEYTSRAYSLLFFVAVGVGVVSGPVFSWLSEQDTAGNPKNADLHKPAEEASFVHHAMDENSGGDYHLHQRPEH